MRYIGNTTLDNNLTVAGDLTVSGTTTSVNSTTLTIDDKNIELAHSPSGSSGNDSAVNGGGITLVSSDSNKTFNWIDSTDSWTSSEHLDLASGKVLKINGTSILTATALGASVVSSSLTSLGTIASGTWQGTAVALAYGGTGLVGATDGQIVIADGTGAPVLLDVGSSTAITVLGTVATGVWQGTAVASQYGGTGHSPLPL